MSSGCFYFLLFTGGGFRILVFFLSLVVKLVIILLAIAFVTLFERKVLRYSQTRVGPNKVTVLGVFQPVLDGVKLLIKEFFFPRKIVFWGVLLGPALGFFVMLFLWLVLKPCFSGWGSFFTAIFLVVFIGLGVYSTLVSGWRRTSKFASLGGVRSCSQSVSYEISLIFLVFCLLLFLGATKINARFFIFGCFLAPLFFLRAVAETNRAPFDFSEGERELISGFNVEFGSARFVLLFLAEYGIILFFCYTISLLFFFGRGAFSALFVFFFIFIRRVYPRFRYDILIQITWTKFLPLVLLFLLFFFVVC